MASEPSDEVNMCPGDSRSILEGPHILLLLGVTSITIPDFGVEFRGVSAMLSMQSASELCKQRPDVLVLLKNNMASNTGHLLIY